MKLFIIILANQEVAMQQSPFFESFARMQQTQLLLKAHA
jgi:hypothetical protein